MSWEMKNIKEVCFKTDIIIYMVEFLVVVYTVYVLVSGPKPLVILVYGLVRGSAL